MDKRMAVCEGCGHHDGVRIGSVPCPSCGRPGFDRREVYSARGGNPFGLDKLQFQDAAEMQAALDRNCLTLDMLWAAAKAFQACVERHGFTADQFEGGEVPANVVVKALAKCGLFDGVVPRVRRSDVERASGEGEKKSGGRRRKVA